MWILCDLMTIINKQTAAYRVVCLSRWSLKKDYCPTWDVIWLETEKINDKSKLYQGYQLE